MLRRLCIRNYAIIESVDLELDNGFIAVTGETGAGKSVLFDAIGLLLGERATTEMVRYGTEQAELEGTFLLSEQQAKKVNPVLSEHGCPEDDELVIKRIITSTGRNRVFINGSRSTLSLLQEITTGLVDVIGQHASHSLLDSAAHISMLDNFAQTTNEASQVEVKVREFHNIKREIRRLQREEDTRSQRIDFLYQQLEAIQSCEISEGDDVALESELERLLCVEDMRERSMLAVQILSEQEHAAIELIGTAVDSLRRVASVDPSLEALLEPLIEARIQIGETCRDLRPYTEAADISPEEIGFLQERLEQINELKHRHGGSIQSVLSAEKTIALELEGLQKENNRALRAEKEASKLEIELMKSSIALSKKRQRCSILMAEMVELELRQLSMPHCRFRVVFRFKDSVGNQVPEVHHAHSNGLTATGLDDVEFEISPNPGEGFKPLAKVASGGELSRIMLALKGSLIQTDPVSTYVFDEVDTGIGGGVAETVGRKLQRVGVERQAICITHLPQVASCGNQHIYIEKQISNNRTNSTIKYLNFEERISEIARMLGGTEITEMSQAHAQELLLCNQPSVAQELRLVGAL